MVIVYGDSPSPDHDSSPTASTVLCTKATVAGIRTRLFPAKVAFPLVSGLHEVGGGQATTTSEIPAESVTPPHRPTPVGVVTPRTPVLGGGVARAGGRPRPPGGVT